MLLDRLKPCWPVLPNCLSRSRGKLGFSLCCCCWKRVEFFCLSTKYSIKYFRWSVVMFKSFRSMLDMLKYLERLCRRLPFWSNDGSPSILGVVGWVKNDLRRVWPNLEIYRLCYILLGCSCLPLWRDKRRVIITISRDYFGTCAGMNSTFFNGQCVEFQWGYTSRPFAN